MTEDDAGLKGKTGLASAIQFLVLPSITAMLGLIAGILTSSYNADLSVNRFFLEKQVNTADNIAVEFSRYVVNWSRLVELRKALDAKDEEPSDEEKEYFKKTVTERRHARDKLLASLDSAHLYFSREASDLIIKFREWDNRQASLTIDRLPDINEWSKWQINILRQLNKEIKK